MTSQVFKRAAAIAGLTLLASSAIGFRSYFTFFHQKPDQKQKLILSILIEHEKQIRKSTLPIEVVEKARIWPANYWPLESWLMIRLGRTRDPIQVRNRLRSIANMRIGTAEMMTTLARWDQFLLEWGNGEKSLRQPTSQIDLFEQGRLKYLEAEGYRKTGRRFDAVPLYLWSAEWLYRSIIANPTDPQTPEALFYLGASYLRLRRGLPEEIKGDRIINLCSELFPKSIWAEQADLIRKSEFTDAI